MGVHQSVFSSDSERNQYKHVKANWGEKCVVYFDLPFLNVFNPENLFDYPSWHPPILITLEKKEIENLEKIIIPYTVCSSTGKPIFCVEFNRPLKTYEIGPAYLPSKENELYGIKYMKLKLKVAHGSGFPYFIMKSHDFKVINKEDKLLIIDRILCSVIMDKECSSTDVETFNIHNIDVSFSDYHSMNPTHMLDYSRNGEQLEVLILIIH